MKSKPATVIARKRKRCNYCYCIIEPGEKVILTDDRHIETKSQWNGRYYMRGAWHLWHLNCYNNYQEYIYREQKEETNKKQKPGSMLCLYCNRWVEPGGNTVVADINGQNYLWHSSCYKKYQNQVGQTK